MQGIDDKTAKNFLDRNKEMFDLHKEGQTMESIGDVYNISKQRVHQIIRRCKIGEGHYYNAHQIEQEKRHLDTDDFSDWLKTKGIKKVKSRFV
jgi:predicted DNA-binding protein YlxM (UPF0122 family)|tara:strand:+ start:139 stop:417 length:279 start_codon:yes stop_codon:yes gene_type:complete